MKLVTRMVKLAWFISLISMLDIGSKPVVAATATATVTANIIIEMSVTTQGNMAFGDVSTSTSAGSVVLSTTGDRTSIGGATINSSIPGSPGEFSATGEPLAVFSVSMPATVQLTSSSNNSMTVDNFISEPSISGQLDGSGNQSVLVGATLHVGSQQAFGSYSGLMSLNVNYN